MGTCSQIWERGACPHIVLDALLAALERSLLLDKGNLVVQRIHLGGLRALGQILRMCRGQVFLSHQAVSQSWHIMPTAQHMFMSNAIAFGVRVLTIASSTHEEATAVALWFLAELAERSPTERALPVHDRLRAEGA